MTNDIKTYIGSYLNAQSRNKIIFHRELVEGIQFVDIGKNDFVFLGFLFLDFHSEFVVIVARRQKKYNYKKETELVFHLKNILKAQSYKVNLSYRIFHFGFSEFFVLYDYP